MATAERSDSKKIIDVAAPGQSAPSTSSRPVLVGNRPILGSDPMMVSGAPATELPANEATNAQKPAELATTTTHAVVTHEAKTVTPLTGEAVPKNTAPEVAAKQASTIEDQPAKPKPEAEAQPNDEELDSNGPTVADAESSKATQKLAEEAVLQQQVELENLIAAGTYAVPINAVKRKRSRLVWVTLVLVVVLAVVAIDMLLDSQVLHLSGIPHTHFLKPR